MTDLLLIEANRELKGEKRTDVPPLGLAYIAAVCEDAGFSVEILDLNVQKYGLGKAVGKAGMIGVSFYTHNYGPALAVLEKAKKTRKMVIAGGPHATPLYREALADGFDIVVRGEGEYPILELLKRDGDPTGIKGLAYMKDDDAVANGVWRVKDLDSLPTPARHLLMLERYSFPSAIVTSRGCNYSCIFCSSRNQSGTLRLRSAGSVVEEIGRLKKNGFDSFLVADPNFAYDKKRVLDICDGVAGLGMRWFAELRLDHIDNEVIKAMSGAGCKVVRFGVESGSQKIVDVIRKEIMLSNIEATIRSLVESGITPVCGFMIGHPKESSEDYTATVALAEKIRNLGGETTFAVQTPYPGTYIYRNAAKLGIDILHRNWSEYTHLNPVINTRAFKKRDLRRMLKSRLNSLGEFNRRRSFRSIARDGA